jgi:myo-inositol-1(or 4)-monophosphatase
MFISVIALWTIFLLEFFVLGFALLVPDTRSIFTQPPHRPKQVYLQYETETSNSQLYQSTDSISGKSNIAMDNIPSQEQLEQVLQVAMDAGRKAGDIILGNAGGAAVTKTKANSRDLLTLIDPLCEKTIKETVLATFPDHDFLGEEDVPPGKEASAAAIDAKLKNSKSDWLWIVDPIDGTTNFANGIPLNMPSIAATYKGEVVVGVIYDPHRDEMFTATKGGGSFLNGKSIKVGEQSDIGDAVIAMGSPPGEESMQMSLKGIQALMPKVRTIRMFGSAAIMLAWIANGRLTAYWEYDLSSWDICAGALLIQEAGGKFTDLDGMDFSVRTRKICATNGKIHDALLQILNDAGVV